MTQTTTSEVQLLLDRLAAAGRLLGETRWQAALREAVGGQPQDWFSDPASKRHRRPPADAMDKARSAMTARRDAIDAWLADG